MEIIKLNLGNEIIECEFERGKRKNLYLVVKEDGRVQIRAPKRMKIDEIYKFVESKSSWILKKSKESREKNKVKVQNREDGIVHILGKKYQINKEFKNIKRGKIEFLNENVNVYLPIEIENNDLVQNEMIDNLYEKLLCDIANREVVKSMDKITTLVGMFPNQLKIRNFKRAWGNCSSKKIISINKDVCKFSTNAIDYVCLHEVCHLKHMNHSRDFWNMVEFYMPGYRDAECELSGKLMKSEW